MPESLVESCKVEIPEGTSGAWSVRKFTVSKDDAALDRLRGMFSGGGRGRSVPEGTYTGLYRGNSVIMSDTPDEIRDHRFAIYKAQGECLVFGLGLGMVAKAILDRPEVTKLSVVDLSPDVIALVAPTLKAKYGSKLEVIQANGLEWKPPKGVRYGMVWADIWDNLCTDNLVEMSRFNRRYGRCSDWHGNWGEGMLRDQARREKGMWWNQ